MGQATADAGLLTPPGLLAGDDLDVEAQELDDLQEGVQPAAANRLGVSNRALHCRPLPEVARKEMLYGRDRHLRFLGDLVGRDAASLAVLGDDGHETLRRVRLSEHDGKLQVRIVTHV